MRLNATTDALLVRCPISPRTLLQVYLYPQLYLGKWGTHFLQSQILQPYLEFSCAPRAGRKGTGPLLRVIHQQLPISLMFPLPISGSLASVILSLCYHCSWHAPCTLIPKNLMNDKQKENFRIWGTFNSKSLILANQKAVLFKCHFWNSEAFLL